MKIETGTIKLADGWSVPKRCVDALDELEKIWPGASFDKARPAIVRTVLEAYPDPRDVMNRFQPTYVMWDELLTTFIKGTTVWYNRPYHAVKLTSSEDSGNVYIWRDHWQLVSAKPALRFEEN